MSDSKRSSNFSKEEEQLLLQLVEEFKHIVECKKSGVVTWKDKEEAWKRIEEEFNCRNNKTIFRNMKALKDKYANMKRLTKKKYAVNKQSILKTGGGSCESVPLTDVDVAIKELLGTQVDGLSNPYDNDSTPIASINTDADQDVSRENEFLETAEDMEDEVTLSSNYKDNQANQDPVPGCSKENWGAYKPSSLKTPVSNKMTALKKTTRIRKKPKIIQQINCTKKYVGIGHELMEEKLNFVKLQKEKFLEEHALRMVLLTKKIEVVNKKLSGLIFYFEK